MDVYEKAIAYHRQQLEKLKAQGPAIFDSEETARWARLEAHEEAIEYFEQERAKACE